MLTSFQRAVLATIAGAAVLVSLVIAAKAQSPAIPLVAAGGAAALGAPAGGAIAPGIVTTGDGTAKVRPDVAIVTVGAVAQAATAAEAQAAVAERVDRILKRAKDLGIADKDTKNAGYSIQPQFASGPNQAPRITGYQATQQVSLTLRSVDGAGKALDALVQGEAGNTISLRFALDDAKPAQAEARRLAIEDARAKAEAMARTAGVRVGRVIAISDQSTPGPIGPLFDVARSAAPAAQVGSQVPAGDLDVVVRVQVQFEIQ